MQSGIERLERLQDISGDAIPPHEFYSLICRMALGIRGAIYHPYDLDFSVRPLFVDQESARAALEACLKSAPPAPHDLGDSRGILICAEGDIYFRSAYVTVSSLRDVGCRLPIEIWYLSRPRHFERIKHLFQGLDVAFVDGSAVRRTYPCRILHPWELKVFACVHSRFRMVLVLDADCVAVADPSEAFDWLNPGTSAVFWPDALERRADDPVLKLLGLSYLPGREFAGSQAIIDRERGWMALTATLHLNQYSDFYYQYMHGDKDTFYFGWRFIGSSFVVIEHPKLQLSGASLHHDRDGNRLFQHRESKWALGPQERVPGFEGEQQCAHRLQYYTEVIS